VLEPVGRPHRAQLDPVAG